VLATARAASSPDDFVEDCRYLIALCEELIDTKPKGREFFGSVMGKVEGMMEFAEERGLVTERMASAVENMRDGVERWVR